MSVLDRLGVELPDPRRKLRQLAFPVVAPTTPKGVEPLLEKFFDCGDCAVNKGDWAVWGRCCWDGVEEVEAGVCREPRLATLPPIRTKGTASGPLTWPKGVAMTESLRHQ